MTSKTFTPIIILASLAVLCICFILFGSIAVSAGYFFGAFCIVSVFMLAYYYAEHNYYNLNEEKFINKLFKLSLFLRVLSVLIIYFVLYYVLGGDLGIEEYDTIFYSENAKLLNDFYRTGYLNPQFVSTFVRYEFDDYGYILILSLKYFISDSLLFIKLTQAIIDSFSVVLFFKILKNIYGIQIAKTGAILISIFFPFILFASLHTKEVYMVYFLLLSIYTATNYVKGTKNKKLTLLILVFSIITIFSMRTVLGIILVISTLGYFIISKSISIKKKFISLLSVSTLFVLTLYIFGLHEEVLGKFLGYIGIEYGDTGRLGGRSYDEYQRQGQGMVKYLSGVVLAPISFITPFPSLVLTNIKEEYGMTMQWIFAGGLFIWIYMSFFSFIGFYHSIKTNLRNNSLLILLAITYIFALIVSLYIMSIRFNVPKLLILLMFTAYGIHNQTSKTKYYFVLYVLLVSTLVIIWNYVKIAGRGGI